MTVVAKTELEMRAVARYSAQLGSTVRVGNEPMDVRVLDLSTKGFSIRPIRDLRVGEEIRIGLSGIGVRWARVVRIEADLAGCEFMHPLQLVNLTDAFLTQTVVPGPFIFLDPSPTIDVAESVAEEEPVRWPLAARIGLILGVSLVAWTVIIVGLQTLFRNLL